MNRFFTRKGGVIPWRQSSDATTPPAETQTILRPHFKVVARGHAIVFRSYGTTETVPAGQTIRRPIFSIVAKGRAIVWRSYGTTEEVNPPVTPTVSGGGGWLPQTRRKSRKQIYEERVKLGILPPPVIKAAAKVAAVAQTVEEFKEDRPKYEEMFLKAIKKTEWLPDYTRAIQAQLAIMELEEEELLLLL